MNLDHNCIIAINKQQTTNTLRSEAEVKRLPGSCFRRVLFFSSIFTRNPQTPQRQVTCNQAAGAFFPGFQSSHGKRRTTQRRRARRRLAARRSFALTSVKAVGQSLRVLLLDVPLSSSTEELEGQTPEKAEKRQTQYQRYVARFCLNSALVSRGEPRRPRF